MRKIGIMETDSENTQVEKRKRGRPRKFDYTELDKLSQQFGANSRRGQQNLEYAMQAFMTLTLACDESNPNRDRVQSPLGNRRPSVFAELGRCLDLDNPMVFWRCAAYLRDEKPPAKKAIATIRRARLGQGEPHESPMRLESAIIGTINAHLARYPATPKDHIHKVLFRVADMVEEQLAEE
jgi:hypothetical protein